MNTNLLDYFYENTSEDCLSELCTPTVFKQYITLLESIDDKMFSIQEWLYFYQYICAIEHPDFRCIAEIKEALIAWTIKE